MESIQWGDLIPWINFAVMVLSTVLMTVFYLKSSQPAYLEKKIGESAYKKSGRYRIIASVFELVVIGTYVIYSDYPLPLPLPETFPWSHSLSIGLAFIIGIPSGYVMLRGVIDAGEDSMLPKKKGKLFTGIYTKIRHPQAMGELPLWWSFSLLLNSPFLALYSLIMIPIFITMTLYEEKDLELRLGKKYIAYKENTGYVIPKRAN
jgi:protein-S-isoprenylcysteine O-methyltransferase Ste14